MFSISSKNNHLQFQTKDELKLIPEIADSDIYIFYFWPFDNLKTTEVFQHKRWHKNTFVGVRYFKEYDNINTLCSKFIAILKKNFNSIDEIIHDLD